MKCFNHVEREAVATCKKCGKGLCKECAEKYTPCMCDACAAQLQQDKQQQAQNKEEQRKQKYKDALVDTRGEFIKTTLIGVVIGIALIVWQWNNWDDAKVLNCVWSMLFGIFIPFGWKFLTYLQSFIPIVLFGTWWFWLIYMIVKAVLSMFIGIPAFIYQLVKTIMAQRKINKLK